MRVKSAENFPGIPSNGQNWMMREHFSCAVINDCQERPRLFIRFQPLSLMLWCMDDSVSCETVVTHIYAALHRFYHVEGNRDSLAVEITSCLVCSFDSREVRTGCQYTDEEDKRAQILS